jgi:hypothetical protein
MRAIEFNNFSLIDPEFRSEIIITIYGAKPDEPFLSDHSMDEQLNAGPVVNQVTFIHERSAAVRAIYS